MDYQKWTKFYQNAFNLDNSKAKMHKNISHTQ